MSTSNSPHELVDAPTPVAPAPAEHFCTLFDRHFLPLGLALAESLHEHCPQSRLWVLCVDEPVYAHLRRLDPPGVRLIPLAEIETAALRASRPGRSPAEYCWTLTPFLFDAVLDRAPDAARVTYLDADLCFFDRPQRLLAELEESGCHVLITEHAFAPEYAHGVSRGRFCVQFMTARRSVAAREVLTWWQQRCLEWCFDRVEPQRYGDQKYLDQWPGRFGPAVHILRQTDLALAPWNASHVARTGMPLRPVFFHCHGLRILSARRARLYWGYRISAEAAAFYAAYVARLERALRRMHEAGIPTPTVRPRGGALRRLQGLWYHLRGRVAYAPLAPGPPPGGPS